MWISRFNEQSIDGLNYRPYTGRPRKMDPARVTNKILALVDDPSLANQTHWTLTKLCGWLRQEELIDLSYRTLVRYLHEHRYARRIPRRIPELHDRSAWEDRREAFAVELLDLLGDKKVEVFFGDEAGFEGDPRPRAK